MVEKLWDDSILVKDPQYQVNVDELAILEDLLLRDLSVDGKANLRHMIDTYARLEGGTAHIAFRQGFAMAIYLVIEALRSQDR